MDPPENQITTFSGLITRIKQPRIEFIPLTGNHAITDWAAIFPDPLMANAIMDRLAHHSHQIILKGESYRKKYVLKFHPDKKLN